MPSFTALERQRYISEPLSTCFILFHPPELFGFGVCRRSLLLCNLSGSLWAAKWGHVVIRVTSLHSSCSTIPPSVWQKVEWMSRCCECTCSIKLSVVNRVLQSLVWVALFLAFSVHLRGIPTWFQKTSQEILTSRLHFLSQQGFDERQQCFMTIRCLLSLWGWIQTSSSLHHLL